MDVYWLPPTQMTTTQNLGR